MATITISPATPISVETAIMFHETGTVDLPVSGDQKHSYSATTLIANRYIEKQFRLWARVS